MMLPTRTLTSTSPKASWMNKTVIARDINGNTYDVPLNELSWRPSAYAIVIQEGNVLLSKQFNGYDLPGGGIDFG